MRGVSLRGTERDAVHKRQEYPYKGGGEPRGEKCLESHPVSTAKTLDR